jgi:ribosome-associated protein
MFRGIARADKEKPATERLFMIRITGAIALSEREIDITFLPASGPGGQNVNKVATAVQLRFDLRGSPSLPDPVKDRAAKLAGRRLSRDGILMISAQRFRSQERNRADALERLAALLRQAAQPVRARRPTAPSAAERRRRLEAKARRARLKRLRRPNVAED